MRYTFIIGVIFLLFVVFISKQVTIFLYNDSINKLLTQNLKYLDTTDKMCKFTNCIIITTNKPEHLMSYGDIYLDTSYNYFILNVQSKGYIYLDTSYISTLHDRIALVLFPTIFFIFLIFLFLSNKNNSEASMRVLLANEALLGNKAMIEITENIHHELNSHVEVIDNKIYGIESVFLKLLDIGKCDEKDINNIIQDFTYIKDSSEQIYNTLNRMKGFKNIKYSNGNKSIYDIVQTAFDIISQKNSNFSTKIDDELKLYSIKHNIELKNADLLNITINHIKNSLDANSNKIHVHFVGVERDFIYFRIIDNGSGIPKEARKKIFEPNFTTKITMDSIRGNGLYLNKNILTGSKGNLKLVDTGKYGTTFEIRLPIVKRI